MKKLNEYPLEVQRILLSFDCDAPLYTESRRVRKELNKIGWDCDYDLSGEICEVYSLKSVLTVKNIVLVIFSVIILIIFEWLIDIIWEYFGLI